jgi:hypothetical protein
MKKSFVKRIFRHILEHFHAQTDILRVYIALINCFLNEGFSTIFFTDKYLKEKYNLSELDLHLVVKIPDPTKRIGSGYPTLVKLYLRYVFFTRYLKTTGHCYYYGLSIFLKDDSHRYHTGFK